MDQKQNKHSKLSFHCLTIIKKTYLAVNILKTLPIVLGNHFALSLYPQFDALCIQPVLEVATKLCICLDSLKTTFKMTIYIHRCDLQGNNKPGYNYCYYFDLCCALSVQVDGIMQFKCFLQLLSLRSNSLHKPFRGGIVGR